MMMNVQCLIVDGGAVDDWFCKMIDNAGDTDYLIVMTMLMIENGGDWRKSMVHDSWLVICVIMRLNAN